MALAFSLKTSGESNGTSGAVTTSSVTLANNALALVCTGCRQNAAGAQTNHITVTGQSLTWDRAMERNQSDRTLGIYRAQGTGASGAITITSSRTDTAGFTWGIVEITGQTTGTNGLAAVNNANPIDSNSITLNGPQPTLTITGTPATGDVTFATCVTEDAESGLSEEGGWTLLLEIIGTLETSISIVYNTGQDLTASWTGCRTDGREAIMGGCILKLVNALSLDRPHGSIRPFPFLPSSTPRRTN